VQRLADRVVLMRDGMIDEICDLQQAMARPDSPLFADEGPATVLTGVLSEADEQGVRSFGAEHARLFVQTSSAEVSHQSSPSANTRLRVLARDVSVALDDPQRISIRNHLQVVIQQIHELPDNRLLLTTRLADGQHLLIEITRWSAQQLNLQTGQTVWALIKSVALVR
jgi:molybdate transport system ATP-binding protein